MSVPPRRKSRSDNQPVFSAIILVIVMISIVGSYFFLQGEKSSNQELMNSLSEKVRVIEDKLSITNEDSVQNMQTFSDQMAFLDKEVRKLWDHRKGYLNNFRELETKSKQNRKSKQKGKSKQKTKSKEKPKSKGKRKSKGK